jgi:hypothetical protein
MTRPSTHENTCFLKVCYPDYLYYRVGTPVTGFDIDFDDAFEVLCPVHDGMVPRGQAGDEVECLIQPVTLQLQNHGQNETRCFSCMFSSVFCVNRYVVVSPITCGA